MKTRKLSIDALLAAMCAVLGAISLNFGNMKITLDSLPVIVGALLFGPLDGMAIGAIGTFIYQLLSYGITATTLLWILPYVLCGWIVGFIGKKYEKPTAAIFIGSILIFVLNTLALYIDSKIYGYYSPVFIFGSLPPRIFICLAKAAAFSALMPSLLKTLRKVLDK